MGGCFLTTSVQTVTLLVHANFSQFDSLPCCYFLRPASRIFATASDDRTIRVWSLDTLEQLYEFDAPGERPQCVAFCPVPLESATRQPVTLVVGFDSGVVRIFDVLATSVIVELRQHRSRVAGVVFAPDGDRFYSSGDDGFVCAYQRQRGWQPVLTAAHDVPAPPFSSKLGPQRKAPSSHFAFSPSGELLAVSIALRTELRGGHFDVGGKCIVFTVTSHANPAHSLTCSPYM